MTDRANPGAAYLAACSTAAFAELEAHGWLRLTGRDRIDLLQRLSTNDLRPLSDGSSAPTVLANAMGRVIGFIHVFVDGDIVYLRTLPGENAAVIRYLRSMIFWQDEVEVTEVGSQVQYGVYGPDAALALSELAGTPIGSTPPGGSVVVAIGGAPVRAWRAGVLEPYAWSLVAGADTAGSLGAALALRLPRLSPAEVETLRIERGLSAWGRELSDQVTPLEAGLADAVSFSKGCYTGQEVLARQANYGKVTRRLVGLRLAQGSSFEPEGTVGAAIETGTGKPGFVGSVAFSPRLGAMIALAVVPREAAEPGNTVVVSVGEHPIVATVEMLPFVPPAAAAGHVQ